MDILRLESLDAGYGAKTVLQNINLTVDAGQFIGVVAPNGTGKSTLLKTIAGVLPPLTGSVLLQGKALTDYSRRDIATRIAVVGVEATYFEYTALQMVMMGRFPHIGRFSGPSAADRSIVQATMEAVGIWDMRLCPCDELSQGERQKVVVARALAQQPALLLLDEPTAHLDIGNQFAILQLIRNIGLQRNMAVIAVIHDTNLALRFSTHLLFLQDGRTLAYGKSQDIALAETLQTLYGMEFIIYRDAAATYVRPSLAE
ncbi:MAG TPA: ABC transporter ATP-binding protein [Negativicutes bacterium]|nr:ABC transporter ATP-binding protein [Negativicutes bacterium]